MKKLLFGLAASAVVLVGLLPVSVSADVNDFTVTNFVADQTLSNTDQQGQLRIVEHISVNFTDYNHGILRAIPDRYKGHSLQLHINSITSDSGAPSQYTSYGSNGNTVLKIGDPNKTVTGAQEYNLDYTLHNVITFYPDHDELYWDVNGTEWSQPFDSVSVTLHMPSGLKLSLPPNCFTGSFGAPTRNCTVSLPDDKIQIVTTQPLGPNQTLTYVAAFNPGYFQPSTWYQTLAEESGPALKFLIPFLTLAIASFWLWWARGRDARGSGIIVAQYDAPDGLKPLEVGAINDFKVDNRDVTATIIDLAIRHYLKIIETKKTRKLAKDTLNYSLELLNVDVTGLNDYEQQLLTALFTDFQVGATVDVSALKNKLYRTASAIRKAVETNLTSQGYFRSNPLSSGKALSIIAAVVLFGLYLGGVAFGLPLAFGIGAGAVVALIVSRFMSARTAKGVAAEEHIKGLKLYLEVAEKDRLVKLQGPDAAYAANAGEPTKTVDLFEKLLPYAMVLGVEKQWAGQFESLYTTPPDWYSGNWTTLNAVYLTSSLNSGLGQAVNSSFSAPSSSGGSGMGGGGFSGGGGGGGGGGGW